MELKVAISTGSCGVAKRSSARSCSGLSTAIGTPRRDALRSSVIVRGLLVPGFWPVTKIASAWSKSSSRTVLSPVPMLSGRHTLHMFEQSGKLLVPKRRTKGWYGKAASFNVLPEV